MADSVIGTEREHAENQTNRCCDGQTALFDGTSVGGIERTVIDDLERSFVEVAEFVRIRIEE
jgi:hypothetical protein